jgi:hypothetical protein
MNVVILVSAGNTLFNNSAAAEYLKNYPKYLLDPEAKIIEPATGAIVLTVGSLAFTANYHKFNGQMCI